MTMSRNAVANLIARYKSVLQNCSLLNTFGSLSAATVLASAMVLGGTSGASGAVATTVYEDAQGETSSYEGDVLPLEGKTYSKYTICGGWDTTDGTTSQNVNTNITAVNGYFDEIHGGTHYPEKATTTADFKGIIGNTHVTVMSDVAGYQYLAGGTKTTDANGTFTTGNTAVLIDGGSTSTFGMTVGGSYAKAGSFNNDTTVTTGATNMTINGGTFKYTDGARVVPACVIGGSTADNWGYSKSPKAVLNVTDASTSLTINGGTFENAVVGGGFAFIQKAAGKEDAIATATVTGNATTVINGGTFKDHVYAGGFASGEGASATVKGDAILTINGGEFDTVTLYGCDATVDGDSILNLGTAGANYSAKINAFQDFTLVNVASGANVTVTSASLAKDSNFTIDLSSSSFTTEESLTVESGAILTINGAGTLKSTTADISDGSWGVVTQGTTLANYDVTTLNVAELLKVVAFSYADSTYTVTVAVDPDAIDDAAGPNAADGMTDFIADIITNDPDTDGADFVLENVGQTEDAAKLSILGGVMPGLSNASAASNNNMNTRMGMSSESKFTSASETSTFLAMNGDGAILPAADGGNMAQGLGIWFMPMYSHTNANGFSSGNSKYGFDTNIVGATLGADYTFASDLRFGLAFNVGTGSATSKGDFEETENDFDYVGVSLYGAKHFDQLGLSFDMGYIKSENDMSQDHEVSDLYGDTDASLFTIGAKAEYLIPLDSFNMTPYAGIRFNYYDVDAYDTMQSGKSLFNTASTDNTVWEIPVGVTFDTTSQVGSWEMTPSLGLGVKFAMGDLEAEQHVSVAGGTSNIVLASEFADEVTFQGALGLGFAKDTCTLGVSYTLDLSENVESHGLSLNLRYEF